MLTDLNLLLDAAANSLFNKGMHEAVEDSYIPYLAMYKESTRRTETYNYLDDAPRVVSYLKGQSPPEYAMGERVFEIENRPFGAVVSLSEDDWEDDHTGAFQDAVMQLGGDYVGYSNEELLTLLINGDTAASAARTYDGANFFSASHPARGQLTATQSNLVSGGGTTAAQIYADLQTVAERLQSFLGTNRRKFNGMISGLVVVAPVALQGRILDAVGADFLSSSQNKALKKFNWSYIFDPLLDADDANDYYVGITGHKMRPLIWQQRKPLRLFPEAPDSGVSFSNGIRRWQAKGRGRAGYGAWQKMVKVTNS